MESAKRIRVALAVLVTTIGLASCAEQSRVDPNAVIQISGVANRSDGSGPLADRPVQLGAGISEGEVGLAILTVGLSCTSGECRGKRFDTRTAADGTYSFEIKGSDTQSSFNEAVTELVTTSEPPSPGQVSGARVSARFKVQTEKIRLPALNLVDPGLKLVGDTEVRAEWTQKAPGPHTLSFETADAIAAWQVQAAGPTAAVDPRLLEDTAGRAVVIGESRDDIEGSDVQIQWRSPGVGYVAGVGAPPSRGRACRFVDEGGVVGAPVSRCDLTDGDLANASLPPFVCKPGQPTTPTTAESCGNAAAAIIDLGRSVPAQMVVVRGCEGGCAVDISNDGTTFVPAGSVPDRYGQLALDGRPITAVRVGLGTNERLREISVWGPRPDTPALKPLADSKGDDLRKSFGGGKATGGMSKLWLVLAVALAVAVLVAAAYVIGRRRRPQPLA